MSVAVVMERMRTRSCSIRILTLPLQSLPQMGLHAGKPSPVTDTPSVPPAEHRPRPVPLPKFPGYAVARTQGTASPPWQVQVDPGHTPCALTVSLGAVWLSSRSDPWGPRTKPCGATCYPLPSRRFSTGLPQMYQHLATIAWRQTESARRRLESAFVWRKYNNCFNVAMGTAANCATNRKRATAVRAWRVTYAM